VANISDLLAFAHTLADAAGTIIRPYFGTAVDVDTKADNSPVSIADREAEAAIRALITRRYPEHGIFGEEQGATDSDKKYVWVIDPIDGTRAFLAGNKEWGTLIALCEDGAPVLGILDQPVTGERWAGVKDTPSSLGTRACPALSAAVISTTSHRYFTPLQAHRFAALAAQCTNVVEDGDCYAYGMLARGERDLVVDAGLKPYDILALVPIIEAAGGVITGWDGAPVTLSASANVLAAGDVEIHKVALDILGKED
jgi:inositol-phosphate phosphatase/L-galactose 1-phosphate phosphatase/histidinol-phosphatase